MPGTPTPNLGLAVPSVGGDVDAWGAELNGDLAILDNLGSFPFAIFIASGAITPSIYPEKLILAYGGAGGISLNLPIGLTNNPVFLIKKMDATNGIVTINSLVGSGIDGNATYELVGQYQYVRVFWDGTGWDVIGNN